MAQAKLRNNLVASLVGQIARSVIGLVFLPLYLPILGKEAFGLVGFHGSIIAIMSLVDAGLGVVANREVARRIGSDELRPSLGNFVRTLEWLYWLVGFVLAAIAVSLSYVFAEFWLKLESLSVATTGNCLAILGLTIALKWPGALYGGVLTGAQKLVFLNGFSIFSGIGYGLGGFLVLKFVSAKPESFFLWQLFLAAVETAVLRYKALSILPTSKKIFQWNELVAIRKFATGNGLLALVTIGLTQADRILISRLLPLQSLGSFTLASQAGSTVARLGSSFYSIYLPRFSTYSNRPPSEPLWNEFRIAVQLVCLLVFPSYFFVAAAMPELLLVWLQNPLLVQASSTTATWLILGSAFNGLMVIPHSLLLSREITSFGIKQNLISLPFFVVLLFYLIPTFGIVGAGISWFALNTGYYIFAAPLAVKRIFGSSKFWDFHKLTIPSIVVSFISFYIATSLFDSTHLLLLILTKLGIFAMAFIITALAIPPFRERLAKEIKTRLAKNPT